MSSGDENTTLLYRPFDTNTLYTAQVVNNVGTTWTNISETKEDVWAYILTIDGEGSGLDADKLDGMEHIYNFSHNSLLIRLTLISKYLSSRSMPMNLRLVFTQATPVVPLPIVKSNTVSPSLV